MNKIQRRRHTINKRMDKLYDELTALQESCPHENVDKEYQSDTGNWCKADDSYWIDFKCQDCDKRWVEDQ